MQLCLKSEDWGTPVSDQVESLEQHIDMEQTERDLVEHAVWLKMREDYIVETAFHRIIEWTQSN